MHALYSLDALISLRPGVTLNTLRALRSGIPRVAFVALRASGTIRAIVSGDTLSTLIPLCAIVSRGSLDALLPIVAGDTLNALLPRGSLRANVTLRPLRANTTFATPRITLRTLRTIGALNALRTRRTQITLGTLRASPRLGPFACDFPFVTGF